MSKSLKTVRRAAGLSQDQLADKTGGKVSQSMIGRIELRGVKPSEPVRAALRLALGVNDINFGSKSKYSTRKDCRAVIVDAEAIQAYKS